MNPETGTYYDRLSRWTAVARVFGYGGGRDTLTVHRMLADPRAGGRPTATRLHDLLLEALPPLDSPRVLDAGCGLGGTLIDLATRIPGTFVGVTLSEGQAQIGREAIARAGLQDRVSVLVQSYDEPPAGPFDVCIAIESLAHSPDPSVSVSALASRLAPGGVLAIVDDMPEPDALGSADLAVFKDGWRLPVLWRASEFATAMREDGLELITDRDLSREYHPRTDAQIERLERLNRFACALAPSAGLRATLDSYLGGLALERLYRRGLMKYRMLIARRG